MATHSSVLAWRIPGTGEPVGLLSMGSHRVGHDLSDLAAAAACNTIQSTIVQYFCFKSRMSGSKHKSSSDVAGTALPRQHWIIFPRRQTELYPVRKQSLRHQSQALQLALHLLLLTIHHLLPSPTSSPSSSQERFLPVHSMPAPVCQLLYCIPVLFKVLNCKILNASLFVIFFIYYLYEDKPNTVQCLQPIVLVGYLG